MRVLRFAMEGELIAFSDLFDRACTIAWEIGDISGHNIQVRQLTDSKTCRRNIEGLPNAWDANGAGNHSCSWRHLWSHYFWYWLCPKFRELSWWTHETYVSSCPTIWSILGLYWHWSRAMDYLAFLDHFWSSINPIMFFCWCSVAGKQFSITIIFKNNILASPLSS